MFPRVTSIIKLLLASATLLSCTEKEPSGSAEGLNGVYIRESQLNHLRTLGFEGKFCQFGLDSDGYLNADLFQVGGDGIVTHVMVTGPTTDGRPHSRITPDHHTRNGVSQRVVGRIDRAGVVSSAGISVLGYRRLGPGRLYLESLMRSNLEGGAFIRMNLEEFAQFRSQLYRCHNMNLERHDDFLFKDQG